MAIKLYRGRVVEETFREVNGYLLSTSCSRHVASNDNGMDSPFPWVILDNGGNALAYAIYMADALAFANHRITHDELMQRNIAAQSNP